MLKTVAVWLAFLGLAMLNACTHERAGEPQRFAWNLHMEGPTARLAYGQPYSDNVGLILSCEQASGVVGVYGSTDPDRAVLRLASGRATSDLAGRVEADPFTGGYSFEAEAPVRAAALDGFVKTGKLSVIGKDRAIVMPASGAERASVRRFFEHCA
ncbi:MAG TPA: hypothetical protein VD929_01875 [Caulobacteraceae bacterium]|nr:hypothetical protein [Caulobacteraceae bacterium]